MDLQELEAIAESEFLSTACTIGHLDGPRQNVGRVRAITGRNGLRSQSITLLTIRPKKFSIRCCMKSLMPLLARKLATVQSGRPWQRNSEPRLGLVTHATKLS